MTGKMRQRRAPAAIPDFQPIFRRVDRLKMPNEIRIVRCMVERLRVISKPVAHIPVHHHVKTQKDDSAAALTQQMQGQIDRLIARITAPVDNALLFTQSRLVHADQLTDTPRFRLLFWIFPLVILRPANALVIPHDIGDMKTPPVAITCIQVSCRRQPITIIHRDTFHRAVESLRIRFGTARPGCYDAYRFFLVTAGTGITLTSSSTATPSAMISDRAGFGGSIRLPMARKL